MNYSIPIAIGLGGFVGALSRFWISNAITKTAGESLGFAGTLTVNLIGCLAIGILATLATRTSALSPAMEKCLITGLLGSLTTFSTFALDSLRLLQDGRPGAALINITLNLVAGLCLVWLGMLLANSLTAVESTS